MPYSNDAKGYTRITVKTNKPSLNLVASNKLYVEATEEKLLTTTQQVEVSNSEDIQPEIVLKNTEQGVSEQTKPAENTENTVKTVSQEPLNKENTAVETPVQNVEKEFTPVSYQSKPSGIHYLYFFFWALLIVLFSFFFYTKAKNKMI